MQYLSNSGSEEPAFVLFDSQLDNLKLPVLKLVPHQFGLHDVVSNNRTEFVSPLVERFFDRIGACEEGLWISFDLIKCYEPSLPSRRFK